MKFDLHKDAANSAKHGISLRRAGDMQVEARVIDDRYEEPRLRAYGVIDGRRYCLAYTIRDGEVRPISLRRAHGKEYRLYVQDND